MLHLFLALIASAFAQTNTRYTCQYAYMGMSAARVELLVYADGEPAASALISIGNSRDAHKESVTPEARGEDELVHVWISKEKPDNAVEMIVYQNRKSNGGSVIINHNIPIGKEIWGDCTVTSGN
ncbi:MAG: hypothetical protein KF799_02925 [Bdellovibrionales bacterium]|nr:hypothetical protein [Bdellovibrionales bacterium]